MYKDDCRLENLYKIIQDTNNLNGVICEIGVYKGYTAKMLCENSKDDVILIDTFEGMPAVNDKDNHHKLGDFNDTSEDYVRSVLSGLSNYKIIKGKFPEIDLSNLSKLTYRIVHIDVDIYQSYKDCLEFFYPRLEVGGYIVMDDYYAQSCLGARIAADEYALNNGLEISSPLPGTCQAIINKKVK